MRVCLGDGGRGKELSPLKKINCDTQADVSPLGYRASPSTEREARVTGKGLSTPQKLSDFSKKMYVVTVNSRRHFFIDTALLDWLFSCLNTEK